MNKLADNLKYYMNLKHMSLREFAKHIGMSHSTLFRVINHPNQSLQPLTKRKIANFIGIDFEQLCSQNIDMLLSNVKSDYKISFIDFNGASTGETIISEENYAFAIHIRNDKYIPIFPKGCILFFSYDIAYQKDICLINQKGKLLLCLVNNSYRLELNVLDLSNNQKITVRRDNVKAVLMKSLNPV